MRGLTGKVVVVAGGGRGICGAIALKFADYGAKVVVGSRTKEQIESVAEEIQSLGGDA